MDFYLTIVPVLFISGILAGLHAFIVSIKGFYGLEEFREIVILGAVFIITFISIFCLIYPISNTLMNFKPYIMNYSFIRIRELLLFEISTGILPLRITSFTIGLNNTITILKTINLEQGHPYNEDSVKELFYFKEFQELKIDSKIESYRNRMAHLYLNISQNTIYLMAALILWISFYLNIHTIITVLLSYTLFYIADDWKIIFKYSLAIKGRILKCHSNKIIFFDLLILLQSVYCLYSIYWTLIIFYLVLMFFPVRLLVLQFFGIEGHFDLNDSINWKYFDKEYDEWTGKRK